MADVSIRIVEDAARAASLRAEDLQRAVSKKPSLVLIGSTGRTPIATYEKIGELGLDLSALKLRMLDAYIPSPSRGFDDVRHPGSFTRFVHDKIFAPIEESKRPRDWVMPPEELTTCEEIARSLEEQPGKWSRIHHPINGAEGSEFVIDASATGCLALVRRACESYETLLASEEIDIVMAGIGPLPYPHLAFNCGPYTRPDAVTHLALLDDSTRRANCDDFGNDMEKVPPFALTTGAGSLTRAKMLWITATGSGKSTAVAHALGDPSSDSFEFDSSIAYALRADHVDLVLDEEAAEDLLADGGFQGLTKRYAEAGHKLDARRA